MRTLRRPVHARDAGQAADGTGGDRRPFRRGGAGRLDSLFSLMAMISLNLGLLNLMPVPVLDGGHITILALEGLARRDFSMKVKEKMLLAGFVLLLTLMVTVIYNDLTRLQWMSGCALAVIQIPSSKSQIPTTPNRQIPKPTSNFQSGFGLEASCSDLDVACLLGLTARMRRLAALCSWCPCWPTLPRPGCALFRFSATTRRPARSAARCSRACSRSATACSGPKPTSASSATQAIVDVSYGPKALALLRARAGRRTRSSRRFWTAIPIRA